MPSDVKGSLKKIYSMKNVENFYKLFDVIQHEK